MRKYKGAEEVQWPIKRDDGVEDVSTGSSLRPCAECLHSSPL